MSNSLWPHEPQHARPPCSSPTPRVHPMLNAVTSVVFDSVRPYRQQPTRLPHPWDSPGKNTGVGCHFLLQCMKVKSESEVAQSCPTLSDPMDCSLPGSSVHGIFQARVLEWGAIAFSESSPKPMSIESVMPSNHLILCRPLLLLSSIFPSIRVFSNESGLRIRRPNTSLNLRLKRT